MEQDYIELRITTPDGETTDAAMACRSISWSGNWRSAARTLSFSPVVCEDDIHLPKIPTQLGSAVQFRLGGSLLMDAYALDRTRDSLGHTVDVTAYDRGLYLTRNSETMRVSGQTAENVTAALCRKFGIQTGPLAVTGVGLTRNFVGVPLYKIIMTLYSLAADRTGKKYLVRVRERALEVVEMAQSAESVVLTPGSNLLSLVTRESASSMTNSVAIYGDDYNLLKVQQDQTAVTLYGLMQSAIRASSYNDPEGHARQVIAENGLQTSVVATVIGNTRLITGNTVYLDEPVTGARGLFWVQGDNHIWSRGRYQTKLTLSLEAVMDRQTAGTENKS